MNTLPEQPDTQAAPPRESIIALLRNQEAHVAKLEERQKQLVDDVNKIAQADQQTRQELMEVEMALRGSRAAVQAFRMSVGEAPLPELPPADAAKADNVTPIAGRRARAKTPAPVAQ